MINVKFPQKIALIFGCILFFFSAEAQMVQLENQFGKYQIRGDACGTNGVSCPITIEKPTNATTVYKAYIYYSSMAGSNMDPGANAITISGGGLPSQVVPITNLTSSNSGSFWVYTRYEDITALLSPGLNAAPAGGTTVYTTAEAAPNTIDGEGIVVIWDNPTVMNTAIHLSLGSRTTATMITDSINTAPINTLQPGFAATLGLGFAFSTGTGSQISTVQINGGVLDVNAGGWDDGNQIANGTLITLGGYGDSRTTNDDEYYDFASFITNGATQIRYDILMTTNHTSDWLNAVYFDITGVFSTTYDTTITLCNGDSLFIGGAMQNNGGVYFDTLTSSLNLDSIVTTNLIINPVLTGQANDSICPGDSLFLGGAFQTLAGTYYDTLTSFQGCDSTLATTLTLNIIIGQTTDSICPGDSILLGGVYQSAPGIYYDTLTSYLGCDSTLATTLTTINVATAQAAVAICQGDSILLGGVYQSVPGIYSDTLSSYLGCDSIVATTLTTIIVYGQTTAEICQGDSLLIGSIYQTQTGTYSDTLVSFLGCDSVVATALTVNLLPIIWTSLDTNICPDDSASIAVFGTLNYVWDNGLGTGLNYMVSPTSTTVYTVTGTDVNGCENTATVAIYVINCDTVPPSSLIIPNVFTPNGDSFNDFFTVIGENLMSITGVIFNRWGQQLFEWDTVDGFWDGGDAPDGTYFYIIDAEGFDGEIYHKKGALSLIR